jgi:hypothetical protein
MFPSECPSSHGLDKWFIFKLLSNVCDSVRFILFRPNESVKVLARLDNVWMTTDPQPCVSGPVFGMSTRTIIPSGFFYSGW